MKLKMASVFNVLKSFNHLAFSSGYDPEDSESKSNETIFLNYYDFNHIKLKWDENKIIIKDLQFTIGVEGNNLLIKFLVTQEDISNNFKRLLDNNFKSMEERLLSGGHPIDETNRKLKVKI